MPPLELDPAIRGIADRIKEVRVALGLNQDAFAHAIGVTRSHLSDIETYRTAPSLPAILGVLGVHLAAAPSVWEGSDDPASPTNPSRPRTPEMPVEPVNARWLLLGPAVLIDNYRPARRTRRG